MLELLKAPFDRLAKNRVSAASGDGPYRPLRGCVPRLPLLASACLTAAGWKMAEAEIRALEELERAEHGTGMPYDAERV